MIDFKDAQIIDDLIADIESEFMAKFSPSVRLQFALYLERELTKMTEKLFINNNGAISHRGMIKLVKENARAKNTADRSRKRRTP